MGSSETKRSLYPKISIIIPFFNAVETLVRSVESVISQGDVTWELILVNDGSKDNSVEIAQSYLNDVRVSLYSQENKGVSTARNFGASKAKGDWLIFLDSDDYLEDGSLSTIANQLISNEVNSFYIFGMNRIRSNSILTQIPTEGKYFSKLAGTFTIKKTAFDNVGGYDSKLKFSENTELFHRIVLAGYTGKSVPIVVLNYFDNPTGGSKNLQNMIDSLTLILKKHAQSLNPHVKHLYHQIIGVNWIRFRDFSKARYHLFEAIKFKPSKIATWGRLGLAFFPFLAKRFYSETVDHG